MIRVVLIFVVLVFCDSVFAQKQLQVTYENNSYCIPNVKKSEIKVIAVKDACLSTTENNFESITISFSASTGEKNKETEMMLFLNHVYKDYQNNVMYSNEEEKIIECNLKEEMTAFKWKLGKERKMILGYSCTQANCLFRGRDYTAWFTTDLPFRAAPWKFYGLPGVMLQVKSKDNFVSMEATELKVTDGEHPQNPIDGDEFFTWEEFAEQYKIQVKKGQERIDAVQARMGMPTRELNYPRIQVIVNGNRLDSNGKKYWEKQVEVLE
jgi:GLPGLI family protein